MLFDLVGKPLQSFTIHAHFYQPPREDPITGTIPEEAGASPYPNWNEKIYSECYQPNALLGNFEQISFDIGPTLFEWMAGRDLNTCQHIVAQDQANVRRFGVGNAIAQPYHHTILPLASTRDKHTQIIWGLEQFEYRFGRKAQGMWLPETAVDFETLNILAELGIQFTILAPWQAAEENLDVTEPYRVDLPGGRSLAVFFYHGGLSGAISFNPSMTVNADQFVRHELVNSFRLEKLIQGDPQLLTIASDGELFGHHQHLRDHFLAHLVNGASSAVGLSHAYPGLWLREHPPRRSIQIRENTSWSCHHGVARWASDCGCVPGDQVWKVHLRRAFDHLAQNLDDLYVGALTSVVPDVWELRDQYIRVVLGQQQMGDLLSDLAAKRLPMGIVRRVQFHLEAQLMRQRMYASCAWFFEDFNRIEPRNSVAYAAQAVRLAQIASGIDLSAQLMADLRQVVSPGSGLRGDEVLAGHLNRASYPV